MDQPISGLMSRVIALAALFVLALVPAAQARDRDKLPDRWERKHHLNLQKNDAKRDRDRDGLSNLREFRAHTNPRKPDTDGDGLKDGVERRFGFKPRDRDSDSDGIRDGRENAGRITQLSATSITIKLAAGGRLSAPLSCAADPEPVEDSVDPEDVAEDESSLDDPLDEPGEDEPSEDDVDEESYDEDDTPVAATAGLEDDFLLDSNDCTSLRKGARVHEATVDRSSGAPVVTRVELV